MKKQTNKQTSNPEYKNPPDIIRTKWPIQSMSENWHAAEQLPANDDYDVTVFTFSGLYLHCNL